MNKKAKITVSVLFISLALLSCFLFIVSADAVSPEPIDNLTSLKINTTQFGGKQITQIKTDENYPCYLQSSGKVICPVIKPDKLDNLRNMLITKLSDKLPPPASEQLQKLVDDQLSLGIPKTDFRKLVYKFNRTEKWTDENGTKWEINISNVAGYEETYFNYSVEQTFDLDYSINGKVRVGFASNVWEITDFSYGSSEGVTARSYGVALENEHADYDSSMVYWGKFTDNATDSSGNGNDGTVIGATHNFSWYDFKGEERIIINSVLNIITKAYWKNNGSSWKSIVVSENETYVNNILVCSGNMSYIDKLGGFCIDKYEASMPSANSTDMGNSTEVADRNAGGSMPATSKKGVVPWVRINQINARIACSNAGKHLCTDEEWLGAANIQGQVYNLATNLRVSPYYCVTDSNTYCLDHSFEDGEACNTGYYKDGESGCHSAEGVYDMVGNVREWTNETVGYTKPCNIAVNGWCYWNGSAFQAGTDVNTAVYGNDGIYFLANTTTNKAVLRGGIWNSGADAGPFCAALNNAPTYTHNYIGFRCCSS